MRDPRVRATAQRYGLPASVVRINKLHLMPEDAVMVMIGRMQLQRSRRENPTAAKRPSLRDMGFPDSRRKFL